MDHRGLDGGPVADAGRSAWAPLTRRVLANRTGVPAPEGIFPPSDPRPSASAVSLVFVWGVFLLVVLFCVVSLDGSKLTTQELQQPKEAKLPAGPSPAAGTDTIQLERKHLWRRVVVP